MNCRTVAELQKLICLPNNNIVFFEIHGSRNYKTLICHLVLEDIFPRTIIIIIIERQQLKGGLLILNQVKNKPHSLRLHDFSWVEKL